MDHQALLTTRRALHGVAELVIAGPQYATSGTIRLRVVPGGFAGTRSPVRVDGGNLVWDSGRTPLAGTCRRMADAAGVTAATPGVYPDGSGVDPDDELSFDPEALAMILGWFGRGDAALRALAPDVEPVLWPEHFDVGFALGEVNYGVSPGDDSHDTPYAYVGPWEPREGAFWNASFGAARSADALPDTDAIVAFFEEGRRASAPTG
jgi:hypothetical protein